MNFMFFRHEAASPTPGHDATPPASRCDAPGQYSTCPLPVTGSKQNGLSPGEQIMTGTMLGLDVLIPENAERRVHWDINPLYAGMLNGVFEKSFQHQCQCCKISTFGNISWKV